MNRIRIICAALSASSLLLVWNGWIWLVELVGALVHLRPEVGEPLALPSTRFQQLLPIPHRRRLKSKSPSWQPVRRPNSGREQTLLSVQCRSDHDNVQHSALAPCLSSARRTVWICSHPYILDRESWKLYNLMRLSRP
jgi:hypothetical protein